MEEVKPRVKLINYKENPERNVAISARLCYSKNGIEELMNEMSEKEQKNLVEKITSLGHNSVLEHTYFYFYVVCSRVCSHQIVRKRIGTSFSQRSQRYVEEDDFDYIIPESIKDMDMKDEYEEWMRKSENLYEKMVDSGVPKEDARFVIPSAIKTNMVISMNARSLMDFINVRTCRRAQQEIRGIAEGMLKEVKEVAPNIFKNAGPDCISKGKCFEGEMSCGNPRYDLLEDEEENNG